MFLKLREKFSVLLSKRPGRVVLLVILLCNIAFILIGAAVIKGLSLTGTEGMGYWRAVYYTVTMILDAGCIDYVVADIGTAGVALVIVCLVVIVLGMVLFTGAVIGYLTNYISGYIESANTGSHKLVLSGHTVILNWNSRASEIVNDLLYCDGKQYVVVLVPDGKEAIEREIEERLTDTIAKERAAVNKQANALKGFARLKFRMKHRFKNNVVCIVREGDTFSTIQLRDISLDRARSIVILGNDVNNTVCKFEQNAANVSRERGNPQSIKALVQVADITSAETSDDDQKIVVETEEDWTLELINKIIARKQVEGKCNIIPVGVNKILGRLLSQFSLMPELNLAYYELFSNKGMTFYSKPSRAIPEAKFAGDYLRTHNSSIPLAVLKNAKGELRAYYAAEAQKDDAKITEVWDTGYRVKINPDYWLEQKNVIILGHNSKIRDIMEGFDSFRSEWNYGDGKEIMNILVIDDKAHLEKMDYYKSYPYVSKIVEADIFDREVVCAEIEKFIDGNETDTSVLILSDDSVLNDEIDSAAIANLIYVSDIIRRKKAENPDFDESSVDVIVEIINPKHYDIVKSYSINNVVISNRYVSKMITQLGEKDGLYDFYDDILSYDENTDAFESKEIYVKKVSRYFSEVPAPCTAAELIRAVYEATSGDDIPDDKKNHTLVLGYVKPGGEMVLFSGNQSKIKVALDEKDKLIIYSNH